MKVLRLESFLESCTSRPSRKNFCGIPLTFSHAKTTKTAIFFSFETFMVYGMIYMLTILWKQVYFSNDQSPKILQPSKASHRPNQFWLDKLLYIISGIVIEFTKKKQMSGQFSALIIRHKQTTFMVKIAYTICNSNFIVTSKMHM